MLNIKTVNKKRDKKLNIRISEEEDKLLRSMGGHTSGFKLLVKFYLENFNKSAENELKKIRDANYKKIVK